MHILFLTTSGTSTSDIASYLIYIPQTLIKLQTICRNCCRVFWHDDDVACIGVVYFNNSDNYTRTSDTSSQVIHALLAEATVHCTIRYDTIRYDVMIIKTQAASMPMLLTQDSL